MSSGKKWTNSKMLLFFPRTLINFFNACEKYKNVLGKLLLMEYKFQHSESFALFKNPRQAI